MSDERLAVIASTVIAMVIAGIGAVMALAPEDLGLSPVMVRWLGVVLVMLGPVAARLPAVTARGLRS